VPTLPPIEFDAMRLCDIDELPDGEARGFDPHHAGRDTIFVVRRGRALHAWVDACPHDGTPMAWRRHAYLNAARDRIVCSAHGALFEFDTGRCTLGPCHGQCLTPVPIVLEANGDVRLA
jgi:nitrite reductase/ring-hydroxylating ferredoxin subunit